MEVRNIEDIRYQLFAERAKPVIKLFTNMPIGDPKNEVLFRVIRSDDRTKMSPKAIFEALARTNKSLETRLHNFGRSLTENGYGKKELDEQKTKEKTDKLWPTGTPKPQELSEGLIDAAISTHKRILVTQRNKKAIQGAAGAVAAIASFLGAKSFVNPSSTENNKNVAETQTPRPTMTESVPTPANTAEVRQDADIMPTLNPEQQQKSDQRNIVSSEIHDLLDKYNLTKALYMGPVVFLSEEELPNSDKFVEEAVLVITENNELINGMAELHTLSDADAGQTLVNVSEVNGNQSVYISDKSAFPDKTFEFIKNKNGTWTCVYSYSDRSGNITSDETSIDESAILVNGRFTTLMHINEEGKLSVVLFGEKGALTY